MKKNFYYVVDQDGDFETGMLEGGSSKSVCCELMKGIGFDDCSEDEILDYMDEWSNVEDGVFKMIDDFGKCVYVGVDEDIVVKTYMSEMSI